MLFIIIAHKEVLKKLTNNSKVESDVMAQTEDLYVLQERKEIIIVQLK